MSSLEAVYSRKGQCLHVRYKSESQLKRFSLCMI